MTNATEHRARIAARGPWLDSGPARMFSLLVAGAFCLGLVLFPQLVIEQGRPPHHGLLLLGLWGMAAGFVHGVGFVPRNRLLRAALGPLAAWPLIAFSTLSMTGV